MQAAENMVSGHTQKGGPAAVMESAAAVNEQLRKVGHGNATKVAKEQGVTVSERIVDGTRVITEAIGRQVSILHRNLGFYLVFALRKKMLSTLS